MLLVPNLQNTFQNIYKESQKSNDAQDAFAQSVLTKGEALVSSYTSVTRSFTYPLLQFDGQVASELTQTITWYTNGTTKISDSRGNSFSTNLPSSQGTFTLLQNSTMVDQKVVGSEFQYDIYWKPVTNFQGFVDKYKFEIVGTSTNGGTISFDVNSAQHLVSQTNQLLAVKQLPNYTEIINPSLTGNSLNSTGSLMSSSNPSFSNPSAQSVEGLGIDWSDAIASGYDMNFNSLNSSIDVVVGKSFSIDPTTIATVNSQISPPSGDYYQGQKRIVQIGTTTFAFYYTGSDIVYKYSTDGGTTWIPTAISAGTGTVAGDSFKWSIATTTFNSIPRIVLFYYTFSGSSTSFFAKSGAVSGTSITWTSSNPSPLFSDTSLSACNPGACAASSGATDSNGNVFVVFRWYSLPSSDYVYKIMKSTDGGLNFTTSLNTVLTGQGVRPTLTLTPLSSGKMLLTYIFLTDVELRYRIFDGVSTWGNVQLTSGAGDTGGNFKHISSASDSTNSAYTAFLTNSNSGQLKVARWDNNGVFQAFESADATLSHTLPSITITTDGQIHIYTISGGKVYETKKVGESWQLPSNPFGTSFTTPDQLTAAISLGAALWTESSNPYNVRFGILPLLPSAPTGLAATTISTTQINLSWTAPTSDGGSPITGYKIERSIGAGSFSVLVPNTGSTNTTYSDSGLTSGTTYNYRVSAINSNGTGPSSNTTSATTFITSTDPRLDSSGEQRVTYFDGTTNFIFYYDGSSIVYRGSSNSGILWSDPVSTGSGNLAANSYFGVYGEGSTVLVSGSSTTGVFTIKGTISGTSISWLSPVTVTGVSGTSAGQQFYPSFEKVGTRLFLGFNVIDKGKNIGKVYESSDLGVTWPTNKALSLYSNLAASDPGIVGVAKYASTKAVALFALKADSEFKFKTHNGASWSGGQPTTTINAGLTSNALKTNAFSMTSDGTCAWVGYVPSNAGGNLKSMKFCDGSNTFPSTSITGINLYPTIGTENGNVELLYINSGILRAITNLNVGSSTWQPEVKPFGNIFDNIAYLHSHKNTSTASSILPVVWREKATSPYTVRFGISNPFNWLNDVKVDNDGLFDKAQFEPHTAGSRMVPTSDTLIAGYIQIDGSNPPRCAVSRSLDSGLSWQIGTYNTTPNLPDGGESQGGDPVITSLLDGSFIYVCLGATDTTDPITGYQFINTSALDFAKSTDNGLTWVDVGPDLAASVGSPQYDKPWIASDWGSYSNFNNRVYVCWTEFDYGAHSTRIKFSQILPSLSNTITIDSATWQDDTQRRLGPYVLGCQISTGPGSELFLTYEKVNDGTSGQILFNRNYNGGDSSSWLSSSKIIGTFQRYPDQTSCSPPANNRILDGCLSGVMGSSFRAGHFPYLAVDKLGDPHVAWTTNINGNSDIVYTSSYNCALSEGQCDFAPQIILDTNSNDQFEPSILVSDSSVSPRGIVIVTANDKREDTGGGPNETWKPWSYSCVPTSTTGPNSCLNSSDWINLKIKDDETFSIDSFVGDYHGITQTKTNQAISTYYFRSCTFCTQDIHSLGAK